MNLEDRLKEIERIIKPVYYPDPSYGIVLKNVIAELVRLARGERDKRIWDRAWESYCDWERTMNRDPIHNRANFPKAIVINDRWYDEARAEIEKEDAP